MSSIGTKVSGKTSSRGMFKSILNSLNFREGWQNPNTSVQTLTRRICYTIKQHKTLPAVDSLLLAKSALKLQVNQYKTFISVFEGAYM